MNKIRKCSQNSKEKYNNPTSRRHKNFFFSKDKNIIRCKKRSGVQVLAIEAMLSKANEHGS